MKKPTTNPATKPALTEHIRKKLRLEKYAPSPENAENKRDLENKIKGVQIPQKYKLTDESIEHNGKILWRIEALRDFGDVKAGDRGGFVENHYNLSHDLTCWIYDNAIACENAKVSGDARLYNNAAVSGWVKVFGQAILHGDYSVGGDKSITGTHPAGTPYRLKRERPAFVAKPESHNCDTDLKSSALQIGYAVLLIYKIITGKQPITQHNTREADHE